MKRFEITEINPSASRIHKDWDEYLPGGPFRIYGKRGSEAAHFARHHPFIFEENIAGNH